MKPRIELVWFSSLVKLPPYTAELPAGCKKGQALRGESFHCQLMFRSKAAVLSQAGMDKVFLTDFSK